LADSQADCRNPGHNLTSVTFWRYLTGKVPNFPFSLIYRLLAELLLYPEAGNSAFLSWYICAN
jgi:hypothetical protein